MVENKINVDEKKKISIITPTYNRAWCIERAIQSVLNQTYKNWELIIIDDGSTDNTKEIIKPYLKDKRIKYFYQKNKGVNIARREGIKKATGKYVTFLDSDDELKRNALELMSSDLDLFNEKEISGIIYQAENQDGKIIKGNLKDLDTIDFLSFIKGKWINGEILPLFKKEVLTTDLFPEEKGGMGGIFWNRLLKKGSRVIFKKKVLRIYYIDSEDRLTGGGQTLIRAKSMINLNEHFIKEFGKDYCRYNPKKLAYVYLEKGIFEIIDKKPKRGRISLKKAIKYNKKKIPLVIIIYVLSFLSNKLFIKLAIFGHRFKGILK